MYDPFRFEPDTPYEVYARVRVEKKGNEGQAFNAGIYDSDRGSWGSMEVHLTEINDNDWHVYRAARDRTVCLVGRDRKS